MAMLGFLLHMWSILVNSEGATRLPDDPPSKLITGGPYRWLSHPMYVGGLFMVTGLAGLAAGIWNAIAIGSVAELIFRDWIYREGKAR